MDGFSIIIPTLNRSNFLIDTLACLTVQEFEHPCEILIVDQSDNSDDMVLSYIKDFDHIGYYYINEFRGLPQARNFGWQKAKYDYILFLDDDILCDNTLLYEHYRFITQPNIGIVAGGITEKFKNNLDCETGLFKFSTATPSRGFHQNIIKEVDHAGGGNFSVKKNILQQLNGIDENLTKGAALYEETDFSLRVKAAGYKILFNYSAHVDHLAADTGGCRVIDIDKYVYALTRNRTIIIYRYLKSYQRITANIYLFKLLLAYISSYRKAGLIWSYLKAVKEGYLVARLPVKLTVVSQ